MRKYLIFLILFITTLSSAKAEDLVAVMQDALRNDPAFRAALFTRLSQKEVVPQARSALLPQANITGTTARVRQKNLGAVFPGSFSFTLNNYIATASQTLLDVGSWWQLMQAKSIANQADATYQAALQELVARTAAAYFAVLQAEDTLRFTTAERIATYRQFDQARQRYSVGIDAVTSVYEAQATYDAVVAREIAARNDVQNRYENLRQITGHLYTQLSHLQSNVPLISPHPKDSNVWVSYTERFNRNLIASRFAAEAARKNINVQASGHLPTVDLVGNYEITQQTTAGANFIGLGSGEIDQRTSSIGVQLNLPVFQGGLVMSQTRQARYDYFTSSANRDSAYRQAVTDTHQSYNNVVTGINTVLADRQTVVSAQKSLESTEAALLVGTRTIVDVLLFQRTLYDAQRRLSADAYAYMNSILALKRAAGTLTLVDIIKLNTWLQTNRHYGRRAGTDVYDINTCMYKRLPPNSSEPSYSRC